MHIMAAVSVIPVAFRLVDEQLMVWVRPAQASGDREQLDPHAGLFSTGSGSNGSASGGGRRGGQAYSLPQVDIGDDESNTDALQRLIAELPFAHDVARVKHCAVFAEPGRVPGRREIALISWVLVRPVPHHEAVPVAGHAHNQQLGDLGGSGAAIEAAVAVARHSAAVGTAVEWNGSQPSPTQGTDRSVERAGWYPVDELPALTHDHAQIVAAADRSLSAEVLHDAVTRRVLPRHLLRSAVDDLVLHEGQSHHSPAIFGLLPDPFPLSAIRRFYERLLGTEIDRGNFRRKLVELRPTGMLKELPIFQRGVRHRAAQLFTFDARAWERWAATDESA